MIKCNGVSFQCNGKDEGHERIHWDGYVIVYGSKYL
jgi:hypothetical protein